MTRKLEDFRAFMSGLKKLGYRSQIPITHLKFFIARDIGTSRYIMDSFIENLVEFGFLEDAGPGIFDIRDGWSPDLAPKIAKEAEAVASVEADGIVKEHMKAQKEEKHAPEQP